MVDDLVDRPPALGLLGGVLAGEEEDLPGALLADLAREVRRAVSRVERADVRVGLHEPRVLARGDGQVGDDVQRVPAPGGPPADDGDHDLGHRPDQALHLEDVQATGPRGVDRVGALDGRAAVVHPRGVAIAVAAAHPLVAAGAERPAAVLRAGPVAGEQHGADARRHARVVERPVQLVDGVRAERVAHLGPVERDAHHRQVALGPVDRARHAAVIREVGEVPEPLDRPPARRVERLGHLRGDLAHAATLTTLPGARPRGACGLRCGKGLTGAGRGITRPIGTMLRAHGGERACGEPGSAGKR